MKKMFLVSFLACMHVLFCATPIDLDEIDEDFLILGSNFDLFEDSTCSLEFKDILEKESLVFSSAHKEYESVTNVESNYWVRISFSSSGQTAKKVLEVITPQTDYISFFVPLENGEYSETKTGYLLPYSHREYLHKNFVFDFQKNADFTKPFYLKVHSSNKVGLLFKIRSQKNFTHYSLSEYLLLGMYYGVLLVLVIYNLIIFFFLRQRVYLAYCFTVLFSIGLSLSDDGLGFSLVWPNHPFWSQPLGLIIFPIGFLIAYTSYAISFFGNRFRSLQLIIGGGTALYLVYFAMLYVFSHEKFYYSYLYSFPFVVIYLCFTYSMLVKKHSPAQFFVVGNTFALVGLIIEQLRLLEVIEGNVVTQYAFEAGIVLEFISLAISLSYNYAFEMKQSIAIKEKHIFLLEKNENSQREQFKLMVEKDALSQKVNKELEDKVADRTREVQESNKKLQSLVDGLESMSITLDKENWQLKRTIKEEKQNRLSGSSISRQEIKELYPTKILCLKFLETLKWSDSYSCSKCQHPKYSIKEVNRSRKCSKCGKIESVTASSLYHSQKIPLQDLFFLTYLAFENKEFEVSTLSLELGISESSIYKFVKKVRDKKSKSKNVTNWEDLIYY